MSRIQLPDEIWIHVFGFLSVSDKLSVRLSCTCFKRLVDHWTLWKDTVIFLEKVENYDSHFWRTLRQRKTKSVIVFKPKAKALQNLAASLPWLSSVTLVQCNDGSALAELGVLKHLERLTIRQCSCRSLTSSLLSLRQLTHLCLCGVMKASASEISAATAQLVNLTSLHYHDDHNPIHKPLLHGMLNSLPNLQHLTWSVGPTYGILPDDYFCPTKACGRPGESPDAENRLRSLEVLDYKDPILPPAAFDGLASSLKKLTVEYTKQRTNLEYCRLTNWLQSLHVLSELSIFSGYPLDYYAKSVPRTVQHLCLTEMNADLKAVRMLAEQVPDLLYFYMDFCSHEMCDIIKELPQLFPKLQILKVRHHRIPVSAFLQLQHLPQLKQLVIVDADQGPSPTVLDLTQKLNDQTNNKIHVLRPKFKNPIYCYCGLE